MNQHLKNIQDILQQNNKLNEADHEALMKAINDADKQWTITDPQGFDTTVAIYNLDLTKKPDPGLFTINAERNFP